MFRATVNPVYATPNTSVTYSVHPQNKICENCKYWQREQIPFSEGYGYCQNPDMPAYVLGGLETAIKDSFGCILWEAKESEGEGA